MLEKADHKCLIRKWNGNHGNAYKYNQSNYRLQTVAINYRIDQPCLSAIYYICYGLGGNHFGITFSICKYGHNFAKLK